MKTKMHCFKRLGERVMACTFERRVMDLHGRVALLNRFMQIGPDNGGRARHGVVASGVGATAAFPGFLQQSPLNMPLLGCATQLSVEYLR